MRMRYILICSRPLSMYRRPSPISAIKLAANSKEVTFVYICLCNGFTDLQVRRSVEAMGCSVAQVYKALGGTPKCGKCVPIVRDMLKNGALPTDREAPA